MLFCSGCTSYSRTEAIAMGYGISGQVADFTSTAVGITDAELVEENPVFNWASNDTELLCALGSYKVLLIVGTFFAGEIFPEQRKLLWGIVGTAGWVPAMWNCYQMSID